MDKGDKGGTFGVTLQATRAQKATQSVNHNTGPPKRVTVTYFCPEHPR